MDKMTFSIVYWVVAFLVIIAAYVLFAKFRDYIINYGKKTGRKYMDKIDPDLEEMDGHKH